MSGCEGAREFLLGCRYLQVLGFGTLACRGLGEKDAKKVGDEGRLGGLWCSILVSAQCLTEVKLSQLNAEGSFEQCMVYPHVTSCCVAANTHCWWISHLLSILC